MRGKCGKLDITHRMFQALETWFEEVEAERISIDNRAAAEQ